MAGQPRHARYARFLLDTEDVIFAIHRHWMVLWRPIAITVAILLTHGAFITYAPALTAVHSVLTWVSLGSLAWLAWQVLEWRHEFFVATDTRLLLTQGLLDRDTATMPLGKVTDLNYRRSIAGQVLGYGTFVFENAGQEQAMREIQFVPQPDRIYRLLVADMFKMPANERDERTWREHRSASPPPGASVQEDHSRAIPVATPQHSPISEAAPRMRAETLFQTPDVAARRRSADTGAIPLYGEGD